jgi:hypothetical protein
MQQEPSDKFICRERHGFLTAVVGIIPPEEGNFSILIGEDAVIADGDPVGISAEVLKNAHWTTEGRFAVDDPLLIIELFPEDLEVAWFLEMTDTARKNKRASFETLFEIIKELASEDLRQDLYVDEEPLLR